MCPFGCETPKTHAVKCFRTTKNALIHCFELHTAYSPDLASETGHITDDYMGVWLKKYVGYKSKKIAGRSKFRCTNEDCNCKMFRTPNEILGHFVKNHMSTAHCNLMYKEVVQTYTVESEASATEESEEDSDTMPELPEMYESEPDADLFAGKVGSKPVSRSTSCASSVADPMDMDDLDEALEEVAIKKSNKKKTTTTGKTAGKATKK
jgi:hypothetical protein